jgi:hypothetical protein
MSLFAPPKGRHGCKRHMKRGEWAVACSSALNEGIHLCTSCMAAYRRERGW